MKNFNQIKEILSSIEADAQKFYEAKNSAAGTRLRKAMQEIKTLAQTVRAEVTELKDKNKEK